MFLLLSADKINFLKKIQEHFLCEDRRVAGLSLTGVTALWSLSKTHLS